MNSKKIILTVLLTGSILGLAACGPKTPEERSAKIQKRVTSKLDLTAEQSKQFKKFADALVQARESLRSDRAQLYSKTEVLLASENISPDQILQLVNPKINQLREEAPELANQLAAFHNTLNPEQREKLVRIVAKIKKHHLKH